ncbi:hypothetical protein ACIQ4I_01420 [Rummeliibacillus sp. NPDC094406]|uniref:hypothetical protein n=1 Tax=Rummeliibacillus sp. NPDC094406 TaxID=3364511 RepID=UPI0038164FCB
MGIGPFASLFMLIIYITPIAFVIWFMVNMVKLQKENNRILQSIDEKLNRKC